jgi:hypothetical protein
MNEFVSYFERTWIDTPTTEPIFDMYLWNMYDSVLPGLPSSYNLVELEDWQYGFQTLVGCSNPTLWTFLAALKKEENWTLSKKVKMSLGERPEPKHRKLRLCNRRLSNIVNDLDDYDPMDCIGEMLFTEFSYIVR